MNRKLVYIIVLILLIVFIILIYFILTKSNVGKRFDKDGYVNILFIGCDSIADNTSRSDTIILLTIKKESNKFLVQYIPRDTLIIKDNLKHKINYIYSEGYKISKKKAIEELRKNIEDLLNIKVPFFVQLDYEGFEKVVDLIGGVEIFIKQDMFYIDRSDNFTIEIPKGLQHLDGKKALEFVRFRSDSKGDIGRLERQKDFIRSVMKKIEDISLMTRSKLILKMLLNYTYTNLDLKDLIYLRRYLNGLKLENLFISTVEGESKYIDGISYYVIDKQKTTLNIRDFLTDNIKNEQKNIILAEVLNGSGINGVAEEISNYLRQNNIDVILIGNAKRFDYKKTIVYDRTGNIMNGFKVGNLLLTKEVYSEKNPEGIVDVTIIIGKDIESFLMNMKRTTD